MIRNIILGAASAVALAIAVPVANAADLPAYEPAPVVAVPSFSWTGAYVGVQAGYSWGRAINTNVDGAVVGAYAGYNVQLDNSPLVLGIETDFNWADIDGKRNGTKAKTDWNGATRARIGAAFDRFMVYGTGGVAYADRHVGGSSKTAVGWTVGGGVEYAATDNILARVDYRFADYGKDNFNAGNNLQYTSHQVLAGIAYKF